MEKYDSYVDKPDCFAIISFAVGGPVHDGVARIRNILLTRFFEPRKVFSEPNTATGKQETFYTDDPPVPVFNKAKIDVVMCVVAYDYKWMHTCSLYKNKKVGDDATLNLCVFPDENEIHEDRICNIIKYLGIIDPLVQVVQEARVRTADPRIFIRRKENRSLSINQE